jgi:chloramphenicol 3-O phosphotransferase
MSKIIYLNGPSSSGKTTIAKALQNAFSEPFLHIGMDKIIGFMPAKMNNWEGGPAPLGFSWEASTDTTGHPIYQIHMGPFAKKINRTLKDIAHLLASQHYNIIIDDVAFDVTEVEEWKDVLKNFDVLYVGVTSPLEILEQREKERGNRLLGGARGQYFKVHENVAYDLEIDTHTHSVEENIDKIQKALSKKKHHFHKEKNLQVVFEPLNEKHFALICNWFNKSHIQAFYSLRSWTMEEVNQKLTPYLHEKKGIKSYVIYFQKQPIGYIQSYPVKHHLWENLDLPQNIIQDAAGIDLFIGEENFLGKGLGTIIVNSFLETHIWPFYSFCLADPDVRNEPSIRMFLKCKFEKLKHILSKDALNRDVVVQLLIKEKNL